MKDTKKIKKQNFRSANREYTVVVYAFLVLFLLLIGYFIYYNVFQSDKVINNSFNKRQDTLAAEIVKGDILDRNGKVLATTKTAKDGTEYRNYPYGQVFAHVVGYTDKGKTGLESAENFTLLRSHSSIITQITNDINNVKSNGDNVVTTLDYTLQSVAYNALGGYNGAVIVMEPKTGKILAMVSKPAFDPNNIAANWDAYTNEQSSKGILVNRATRGLYPPGSTFKILTLLEYIRENKDYENFSYTCKGYETADDFKLRCYDGTAHGKEDLTAAFANSCNSAFSKIGLSLDINKLRSTCERALFNKSLPTDIACGSSSFVLEPSATKPEIMMTAIGQGETVVTPMHMAMIGAAIANDGVLMAPYLVDHTVNDAGITVSATGPRKAATLFDKEDCDVLKKYMRAVVTQGTVYQFKGAKYEVAGKTGTAEYSSDKTKSHSWFVGFANVEDPEILVTAIVEDADGVAPAVARQIMDAYYAKK
ncbi:MAG: penicillin-binding protein 2 [Lachnospiraceae bacterium]|nr:penicillin-binding protein 2 [Lachnospiraceae bacterium]